MRLWTAAALVLMGCGSESGEDKQAVDQGIPYGGVCEVADGGDPTADCRQPDSGYLVGCWALAGMTAPSCVTGTECNLEADPSDTSPFTEAECKAMGGTCRYPDGGSGSDGSFCYPSP